MATRSPNASGHWRSTSSRRSHSGLNRPPSKHCLHLQQKKTPSPDPTPLTTLTSQLSPGSCPFRSEVQHNRPSQSQRPNASGHRRSKRFIFAGPFTSLQSVETSDVLVWWKRVCRENHGLKRPHVQGCNEQEGYWESFTLGAVAPVAGVNLDTGKMDCKSYSQPPAVRWSLFKLGHFRCVCWFHGNVTRSNSTKYRNIV